MKRKILFIINPISGTGKKKIVEKKIKEYLDFEQFDYKIQYTNAPRHAIALAKSAIGKYDIVVAVGGDGSVNEVSNGLIGSSTALGIIPAGSGNGFARHMKIPLQISKAIKLLNKHSIQTVDAISINSEYFVNVAGLGFDAHIAHQFEKFGKRGFISYLQLVFSEYLNYKPEKYTLQIDGKTIEREAFLVSFANSTQFGNAAHIAPTAKIDDGQLKVCILKQFPAYKALFIGLRLFLKNIHKSKYMETISCKELIYKKKGEILPHMDGEAVIFKNDLNLKVLPLALKVICPIN